MHAQSIAAEEGCRAARESLSLDIKCIHEKVSSACDILDVRLKLFEERLNELNRRVDAQSDKISKLQTRETPMPNGMHPDSGIGNLDEHLSCLHDQLNDRLSKDLDDKLAQYMYKLDQQMDSHKLDTEQLRADLLAWLQDELNTRLSAPEGESSQVAAPGEASLRDDEILEKIEKRLQEFEGKLEDVMTNWMRRYVEKQLAKIYNRLRKLEAQLGFKQTTSVDPFKEGSSGLVALDAPNSISTAYPDADIASMIEDAIEERLKRLRDELLAEIHDAVKTATRVDHEVWKQDANKWLDAQLAERKQVDTNFPQLKLDSPSDSRYSLSTPELAALRDRLRRLEARIVGLEAAGITNGALSESSPSSRVAETSMAAADARQVRDLRGALEDSKAKMKNSIDETKDEVANVVKALRGVQRNADKTDSQLDDLTAQLRMMKTKIDTVLPQFLQVLSGLACQASNGNAGVSKAAGAADVTTGGSSTYTDLQRLLTNPCMGLPFASEEALKSATEHLEKDVHGQLKQLRQDVVDALRGKASTADIHSIGSKLDNALSGNIGAIPPFSDDPAENAAGVRWPLMPARCLSCNNRVELINPWERRAVPSAPFPQRPMTCDPGASPRRDAALPTVSRKQANGRQQ